MFAYYWNQTIYFKFIQGRNISKPPAFLSFVDIEIEKHFAKTGERMPVLFKKVEKNISIDPIINKLVKILKQDVSHRFLTVKGGTTNLYNYKEGDDELFINDMNVIADHADVLLESINYRWTQILETFNSSPKIAKKVKVLDLPTIKRNSLTAFRPYLNIENPTHLCFICNDPILNETPSIDHLIPWSFIFSDDLWNLVYTHQRCNSSKSNTLPQDHHIKKLITRNLILFNKLKINKSNLGKKPIEELKLAIEHNYVDKFWINCKN
jgi:5-methylcytosine-specific restriction endonuclease McrA